MPHLQDLFHHLPSYTFSSGIKWFSDLAFLFCPLSTILIFLHSILWMYCLVLRALRVAALFSQWPVIYSDSQVMRWRTEEPEWTSGLGILRGRAARCTYTNVYSVSEQLGKGQFWCVVLNCVHDGFSQWQRLGTWRIEETIDVGWKLGKGTFLCRLGIKKHYLWKCFVAGIHLVRVQLSQTSKSINRFLAEQSECFLQMQASKCQQLMEF